MSITTSNDTDAIDVGNTPTSTGRMKGKLKKKDYREAFLEGLDDEAKLRIYESSLD